MFEVGSWRRRRRAPITMNISIFQTITQFPFQKCLLKVIFPFVETD